MIASEMFQTPLEEYCYIITMWCRDTTKVIVILKESIAYNNEENVRKNYIKTFTNFEVKIYSATLSKP